MNVTIKILLLITALFMQIRLGAQGLTNFNGRVDSSRSQSASPKLHLFFDAVNFPAGASGAGGMRGYIYMAKSLNYEIPNALSTLSTNRVEILKNGRNIVLMICDNGPIYNSTNSGVNWQVISRAGDYKIPLGPGWIAGATILPTPENQSAGKTNVPNWYVISPTQSGGKIVISGDTENPAPILNIQSVNGVLTVSWSATFSNFKLQMNTNLFSGNWADVPDAVKAVGSENQVIVSNPNANNFYRLKSQ